MSLTKEQDLKPRRLTSWIKSYLEYTDGTPTPLLFRKWAAVSAIAGALERRVWVHTAATPIYPNLFIVLVSPPGVGKDQAINPMRELWAATGCLNVAPISMTHKGLIDQLADESSNKQFLDTNPPPGVSPWVSYHSLLLAVPELGVFIDSHDLGFLSALNELYNCWDLFEERQRTTRKGQILRIEKPHLHIIAGTQPKYLGELLPEAAYGMGFTARIIFVYSGSPIRVPIFSGVTLNTSHRPALVDDLKSICALRGPFVIEREAQQAIERWHLEGSEKTRPNHSRLLHYSARRILHVIKLSMVFSTSRSNEMVILKEDFEEALSLLLETEALMPEIFKDMSTGGQAAEIEEAMRFLIEGYMKRKGPVPESALIRFLSAKIPAYQIKHLIETLFAAGMVKEYTKGALMIPGRDRLLIPESVHAAE